MMVRRTWWAAPATGLRVVLLASIAAACGSGDPPEASTPPPAVDRPSLVIEERTEALADATRPTDAVGTTPASSSRSLPTVVLAPAAGQPGRPYPLVVFAHGSGGRSRADNPLLRAWASAGYVVAAPTFPFGGGRAPEGESANDYPNQPADMSHVIDELLRLNADDASPLRGSIDPARIGAAGHSLGGMTTLALAANTCCHDERVKAAIVLAGREVPFKGEFWPRIRTPVLFVHGDADASVPYSDGRRAFAGAPPPRFLVTILGGDHGRPFGGAPDDAQARVVTATGLDFLDHYLKDDPVGLDRLRADATVAGVARFESEL